MTTSNYIFLRALAKFNPQDWQLLFFYSYSGGGLQWFACFSSFSLPIVPNSGGGLWWFAVVCGGLRWFVLEAIQVLCNAFSLEI